jgi:uncharacterized protein (TIGR02284 family)
MGMADQTPRVVLNHLIETCRDSERGYRAAAELVASQTLNAQFLEIAEERARFAEELLPQAQRLGGDEAGDGTTVASLHRRWMDLKARLTQHDDHAVFAEVLRGDTVTLRTYETALSEVLPTSARELVEQQEQQVRHVHARLEALASKVS